MCGPGQLNYWYLFFLFTLPASGFIIMLPAMYYLCGTDQLKNHGVYFKNKIPGKYQKIQAIPGNLKQNL
jgi:hypothetical protein